MRRRSAFAADSQTMVLGALRLLDVAVVVGAGFACYWVRHGTLDLPAQYLFAIGVGALLLANYAHIAGLYRASELRRATVQFGALAGGWLMIVMALLVLAYLTKYTEYVSRAWATLWVGVTLAGFLAVRSICALLLARWLRQGKLSFNVAIVGAGIYGQRLVRHFASCNTPGFRLLGLFDDRTTRVPSEVDGYKLLGTVDDLLLYVSAHRVDEIVIALPWRAGRHVMELMQRLKSVAADVKLCPELIGFQLPNLGYDDVAGVPMLKVFERPINGWNTLLKAAEDRVLGALLLILTLPLFLAIAVAIKLDSPGPVFFRQRRYGFNNDEFTVLKFRTMVDAPETAGETAQARRNDPRLTRIGAILRRTSLDELPQLVNVLRRDMSLVGPRPHAVLHNQHYARLIDDYLGRHRVKPGMTGWAQVNGLRGETRTPDEMRQRVRHDIYYIENWSLLFDLKILLLTCFVGFINENAY